jgi:hypothetical protein
LTQLYINKNTPSIAITKSKRATRKVKSSITARTFAAGGKERARLVTPKTYRGQAEIILALLLS